MVDHDSEPSLARTTMRAWEVHPSFGLSHLHLTTRAVPSLHDDEVLLRVRCVSLNYRDFLMVEGRYNPKQPLPLIPVSDAAAQIVAVGGRVSDRAVGERVMPVFAQGWDAGAPTRALLKRTLGGPLDGMLREFAAVPARDVVSVPEHLTDEEASTLPCAALTAWSALMVHTQTNPGDTILVQGSGGVSLFALQFAKTLGARVIAISSSDEKMAKLLSLGADETINYKREPQWGDRAREMTGGKGVDHVIEVAGAETFAQSLRATRPAGTISVIGMLSGFRADINLNSILMNQIRLQGVFIGHKAAFESMNRAIAFRRLRPVVGRVFGFDEASKAFEHLTSRQHFGKVCVRVSSSESL